MNKDKHKLYMAQILGLIFRDKDLCRLLAAELQVKVPLARLIAIGDCWLKATA